MEEEKKLSAKTEVCLKTKQQIELLLKNGEFQTPAEQWYAKQLCEKLWEEALNGTM